MKFQFDQYVLHARIAPMLITLMPSALLIIGLFPTKAAGMGIIVGAVSYCGMLVLLANLARDKGKNIEPALFKSWGGAPTSILLDEKKSTLNKTELTNIHSKLETMTGISYPEGSVNKNEVFFNWVKYLRVHTRDTSNPQFKLVHAESINYGFRRNLYGLKTLGVMLSFFSALILCAEQFFRIHAAKIDGFSAQWASVPPTTKASLLVILATLYIYLVLVNAEWVRGAGTTYAKRLLECVELLLEEKKGTQIKSAS